MSLRLSAYRREFLADEAAFRSRLTCPMLVANVEFDAAGNPDESSDASIELTDVGRKKYEAGPPPPKDPRIFEIRKTAASGSMFPAGVTVGRMDTNDIVLSGASISRFHAYFQLDSKSTAWRLCDAESSNGTWIGPLRLDKGGSGILFDKSSLRIGKVSFVFYLPESFVGILR